MTVEGPVRKGTELGEAIVDESLALKQTKLVDLRRAVAMVKDEYDSLKGELSEKREELETLREAYRNKTQELQAAENTPNKVPQEIDAINETLVAIEDRFLKLEEFIAKATVSVEKLNERYTKGKERLKQKEAELEDERYQAKMAGIDHRVANAAEAADSVFEQFSTESRLVELYKQSGESRLNQLEELDNLRDTSAEGLLRKAEESTRRKDVRKRILGDTAALPSGTQSDMSSLRERRRETEGR